MSLEWAIIVCKDEYVLTAVKSSGGFGCFLIVKSYSLSGFSKIDLISLYTNPLTLEGWSFSQSSMSDELG